MSSLAGASIGLPSLYARKPWATPGYGDGMGADNTDGAASSLPAIRLGSPTGGLAPGNGWGDAPTIGGPAPMPGGVHLPRTTPAGGGDEPYSANQHHGFFAPGGVGNILIGSLADGLLSATGHPMIYGPAMLQQRQEASKMRLQQSAQAAELQRQKDLADYYRANTKQAVSFGGGGVGEWSPTGGFTVLRQPDAPEPKTTPLEQNVALWRKLNPGVTDAQAAAAVQRALPGYGYDPTYMGQKQANAVALVDERATQARATKGTPTYAATHPRPAGGGGGSTGGGAAGGVSTRDLLRVLGR